MWWWRTIYKEDWGGEGNEGEGEAVHDEDDDQAVVGKEVRPSWTSAGVQLSCCPLGPPVLTPRHCTLLCQPSTKLSSASFLKTKLWKRRRRRGPLQSHPLSLLFSCLSLRRQLNHVKPEGLPSPKMLICKTFFGAKQFKMPNNKFKDTFSRPHFIFCFGCVSWCFHPEWSFVNTPCVYSGAS